jgi:hypothetical protein
MIVVSENHQPRPYSVASFGITSVRNSSSERSASASDMGAEEADR